MQDKLTKSWTLLISGLIIFYGLEILERNAQFNFGTFLEEPIFMRYLNYGRHTISNGGIAPELYVTLQLLGVIFAVTGFINLLKEKFN